MSRALAAVTIRDCVCAGCWGHLIEFAEQGQSRVECAAYGAEHTGFVSKAYADTRRAESAAEAYEVKQLLQELRVIERPQPKSEQQILSELGF